MKKMTAMSTDNQSLPPLPEPAYRGPLSGEPFWNSLQIREYGDARDIELTETLAKASMQIYALKRELRNCVSFMEHVAMECGEDDTPKNFALAISRAHEVLK